MNREIKFRAFPKDPDDGNCMIPAEHFCLGEDFQPLTDSFQEAQEHYYLMQFTGLLDSTGKEVYEGDIIESIESGLIIQINNIFPASRFPKYDWCEIVGQRFGNKISRSNGIKEQFTDDWLSNPEYYKIIGNIHENPELLEGKE